MDQSNHRFRILPEKLRWLCPSDSLGFECTDELEPLSSFVGQTRALKALDFGLELDKAGYNLFVTGLTGTGKTSAIQQHLRRLIEQKKASVQLNDWCYVYNFQEPDRPRALKLTQGEGRRLKQEVDNLLNEIREAIPQAFSSSEYTAQRDAIVKESQAQQQQLTNMLEQEAGAAGFVLQFTPVGIVLVPVVNGQPLEPQAYMQLPQEQRQEIEARRPQILDRVQQAMIEIRALERETRKKMHELNQQVGEFLLNQVFQDERESFGQFPEVVAFLDDLKAYALSHLPLFLDEEQPEPSTSPRRGPLVPGALQPDPFIPFQINVMMDNGRTTEPPVVLESNPTWSNLFGTIERRAMMGTYLSDHTMLKPGSIHRANGGYLVVNARDVLTNPGVWEGLKRVIRNRQVLLEDPAQQFGFLMPQGLRPKPIAAELKVIMVGDDQLYRLLSVHDRDDFWEMFKVKAEFDSQIDTSETHLKEYAEFICYLCQTESLRHFDRTGVARVVEYGARMVNDQTKLSTRFGQLKDFLIEADYWARKADAPVVTAEHVQKALEEKIYRLNLVEERLRDLITEGTIMVDVEGEVVGQVNGLAVYDLGDFAFGRPSRITAQTFAGRRGIINIERESQLSGRIHDKGVLILSGYLGSRYAQQRPLALSASVCFEQSYDGVEGDSASSTELYAILSSLSGLPIKQGIAVTGSVNQKGEVQPIGGVNQKIEGFFDVCRVKGLTGEQGVLIPHQNVKNLMLRDDVVQAAEAGTFHIWSVHRIDEGIEILTGVPAGDQQVDGTYPEGTVNFLVQKRLIELNESLRGAYASMLEEPR